MKQSKQYISNKVLIQAFKDVGLSPQLKIGDWLNISRPDGMHCEFYPNDKTHSAFTATYSVNREKQTLDFYMPDDLERFVRAVCQILNHKPNRKAV